MIIPNSYEVYEKFREKVNGLIEQALDESIESVGGLDPKEEEKLRKKMKNKYEPKGLITIPNQSYKNAYKKLMKGKPYFLTDGDGKDSQLVMIDGMIWDTIEYNEKYPKKSKIDRPVMNMKDVYGLIDNDSVDESNMFGLVKVWHKMSLDHNPNLTFLQIMESWSVVKQHVKNRPSELGITEEEFNGEIMENDFFINDLIRRSYG
jgi:hypothetical protein